ncbi:MAG: hypothetical protein A2275_18545 [Bacteroidetes bacterium RIFOXYA12_FULL_35_11]|nr:MAG: hypothetical protein A2X01_02050 [Bacteroidetes bacterium GWF2_35_48]OFY83611.1 MAG: hypothetical protein A2275_18545 [Bacteroidetes bacterium RIFOXYA12_FULL_35_11]OFY92570.1 MAG: hypothetical protein A2309_14695 [Bacteroidetes bacterium RIFOXYB2_FULL_35_7]OFY96165.1 MAG: hypothetical protein A2491_03155 [Bacteroidetes bacterium RIFOXYC12_FULL_35_7]HBX51930.1 DUF262 domain-containing protein [Bacteroidales bacterium]
MKTFDEIQIAEEQIKETQVDYNYRIADFSIGELLKKFVLKGQDSSFEDESISGLYVPKYQRDFVWPENMQSKFIESILMGVPIQYLFAFELDEDGNLELLDGVQRLSSIKSFVDNVLILSELEELDALNGFTFNELNTARKRKFLNTTLKLYIIDENTDEGIRADIFRRVNEGGKKLEPAEIRKGKFIGNQFYNFILEMADSEKFNSLFSSTKSSDKLRGEKEELITRFFALSNNYQCFVHSVKGFLDEYIIETDKTFNSTKQDEMKNELHKTLNFVQSNFPYGFKKSENSKSIPRVRFEAIAVGTNLALRENPDLTPSNLDWINSNEFKKETTSDAANNKSKVVGRIEFVKNCLSGNQNLTQLNYGD